MNLTLAPTLPQRSPELEALSAAFCAAYDRAAAYRVTHGLGFYPRADADAGYSRLYRSMRDAYDLYNLTAGLA